MGLGTRHLLGMGEFQYYQEVQRAHQSLQVEGLGLQAAHELLERLQIAHNHYMEFMNHQGASRHSVRASQVSTWLSEGQEIVHSLHPASTDGEGSPAVARRLSFQITQQLGDSPQELVIAENLNRLSGQPLAEYLSRLVQEQFVENLGPLRGQLQALLNSIQAPEVPRVRSVTNDGMLLDIKVKKPTRKPKK